MKKAVKKLLSCILVAVMLLTAAPLSGFVGLDIDFGWLDFSTKASALDSSGSCGDNVTYTFDSATGLLIISGTGEMSNTSIFQNNNSIKTVIIENGVTSISRYAFYCCTGLTSVTIPDSVTSIGWGAFLGCTGLTSITIPDSVTSIGNYAFIGCTGLISVTIGNGLTSIGDYTFRGCTGLTSITIPDGVTSIGNDAFDNCTGLKELTIPCSAKIYNSQYTFGCCTNIEKVTLTKGTGIMQDYWYNSSNDTTYYGYTPWYLSKESIKEIIIEDGVQNIGNYAFYSCTGLTSITIPDSVTSIGDCALAGCTGLTGITIPDSVVSIGDSAFSSCTGLENITIPDSVTSIGDYAFEGCTGVTSIVIPDSVTSIGNNAFSTYNGIYLLVYKDSYGEQYVINDSLNYRIISKISDDSDTVSGKVTNSFLWSIDKTTGMLTLDCNGTMVSFENDVAPWIQYEEYIKHIVINDGCTNISKNSFMLCSKVESVSIPNSVTNIDNYAFYGCSSLTDITISDNITNIGDYTFYGCNGLTIVTIGNNVYSIGSYAFYGCVRLTDITIPDNVTSIGNYVFYGCKGLTNVTIGNSVISIGNYAFYGCVSLTDVSIPDSSTSIGSYTFYGCKGLANVTIGNSLISISSYTFYDCTNLTSVTIGNSVTSIDDYSFYNCNKLKELTLPCSAKLYNSKYAFYNCSNIEKVTLTKGTGTMQSYGTSTGSSSSTTYYEYTPWYISKDSIEEIFIEDGVKEIGRYAFCCCTLLTSIIIPNSVKIIGGYAFMNCTGLTSMTIPDSLEYIADYAFYNCIGLTSMTIPDSVEYIGNRVFYGCSGLTIITISDIVTSIGDYAFYDCSGLTSITIPDSVSWIGNYAFYNCNNLKELTMPCSANIYNSQYTFYNCKNIEKVTITKGTGTMKDYGTSTSTSSSTTHYQYTPWYISRDNIKEIVIDTGITNIGAYAFYGSTNIENMVIPHSVTSIGAYAFNGCTALEKMVIPYSVNSIGSAAFAGCTNLGSLTVYSRNCTFADDATAYYTTICGFTGSTAETYANEKGFDFVAIDDTHTHVYDNDCDSICNLCGAERTVGEHIFGDYTVTKEPTCTEQGEKTRTCSVCGYSETAEVPATGHTLGEYNITKEPTCTEQGEKTRTCSVCGYSETAEVPATGHTYDSDCDTDCNVCGAVRVPPHSDNDTNGICDNCGAYLSDIALSTVKDVAVSAGEIVYLKFTAPYTGRYTFYSSSSSDTYGYVCDSNKNSLVSDDDSGSNNNFLITTTLTQGTVYYLGVKYYSPSNSGTIPVMINYICDHTSTHTEHKDSTCTEHGYDKSVCDICGATVSTTELPYKHDYATTITDPTCTEQGYTTYTCSLCGDSYIADYTEPLNHPQKTWRVTKNPTADSTGLMIETCDLCGTQFSEMEIPMLIPNYVTGITVSPNRLALNVGETANLTAIITPDTAENKNVIWSSSDTDIATVANGVVTAKTPGVAVIIAQSEDGGYKDICVVRVASLTPANGAVVDNENGLIYGISSNSADINSYVNTVDDTMTVECDSALLGTGSVVNIVKDDVVVDSYKIVVFGDVNGDGWYDGMDAVTVSCIANGLLTKDQIGEAAYMAADCNHDGVVDEFDVAILNQAGVLLTNVDQTKTQEELAADSAYSEYLSLIDQTAGTDTEQKSEQTQESDKTYESIFEMIIDFIKSVFEILISLLLK